MIVVTGATGRIGRLVVEALVGQGEQVRAVVRDPGAARATLGEAVDIATADLADQRAVTRAMRNARSVFLCTSVHPDQVLLQGHVVNAATEVGTRVVKLSGLATFAGSYVDSGRWHAETEDAIRRSGLPHTFLHPYFFSQNLAFALRDARERGVITSAIPDANIAMVDVRDIAAVAATVLRDAARVPATTLVLTGPDAVSYSDVAAILANLTGRSVACRKLTHEQLAAGLRNAGQPEWHTRLLLQFNQAFAAGLAQQPTTAVADVLGRAPIPVEASLRAMAGLSPRDNEPSPS
jgi:uncharacterized protein YbjT (DUF2867 family)